jgi:hypothetical protein
MIYKYIGIPKVILKGNMIAKAIDIYKLGLALGAAIFITAGTVM